MLQKHQVTHGTCPISQTIKDASELVDSFLNRNRTYGELLSEVAKAKDRQILLKQEQAMLLIENAKL